MSYIYSLAATWDDTAIDWNGIQIDVSDGLGGSPQASILSRIINLKNNGTSVLAVDVDGGVFMGSGLFTTATKASAAASYIPSNVLQIETLGYTTAGDGGGAIYQVTASTSTNVGQFQTADGRHWAIADYSPNLKQLGCKCDGTDDTANLAAVTTWVGGGSKKIIIPVGTTSFTSWSLDSVNHFTLMGAVRGFNQGQTSSRLQCTATSSATTPYALILTNSHGLNLTDFDLLHSQLTWAGILLNISSTVDTWNKHSITNVNIGYNTFLVSGGYLATNVYMHNTVDVSFTNCEFVRCNIGVLGRFTGEIFASAANQFIGCRFALNELAAVFNVPPLTTFVACKFEPATNGAPIGFVNGAGENVSSLNLIGCSFADATIAGVWVNFALVDVFGLCVSGGSFAGNNVVGLKGLSIGTVASAGVSISGVYFSALDYGIKLNASVSGLSVTGNTFNGIISSPIENIANAATDSNFFGNNPAIITETGTGAFVRAVQPTFTNGINVNHVANVSIFTAQAGGSLNTLTLDNLTAGKATGLAFSDAGSAKWIAYKETDNSFKLQDFVNSVNVIAITPGAIGAGIMTLGYTTDSSSTTTGSLVIPGGVGIAKALFADSVNIPTDRSFKLSNQTSAAGAGGGTLLNAPTAGNPTFWLKTVVNGVNIAIPGWPG